MSKLSFRPRPLDIHKKLLIVKSVKDFDDDDTPTSTRNSQLLRFAADAAIEAEAAPPTPTSKILASEIPTPQFVVVDTYERDYSRTFAQPNSYLRARGARAELGEIVEYDLDNEDEDWLYEFNNERKILAPEKLESLLFKLEVLDHKARERAGVITPTLASPIPVLLQFDVASELGETISPMKEDFIMVHLQYACSHCCILMVSGNRWSCTHCRNFQLCDKCYEAEQKREERDRHPTNQREKHELCPFEIADVSVHTKDKDDTLRRAKHSSMMVLYHLHNPNAPAFLTTCNICHLDIETGQGWRCEVCPEYDICNNCYQREGGVDHHHKLTNHPSIADRDAQNKEARQMRVLQLRKMLDLLVHASQCRSAQCQYPNCRKVKWLFRHGIQCKVCASGGCLLCKKMWYLLQLHARSCKEAECHVPRCRDLKEHLRRLQQQSDSQRRAAVMEMMRQRAAELHNNSG